MSGSCRNARRNHSIVDERRRESVIVRRAGQIRIGIERDQAAGRRRNHRRRNAIVGKRQAREGGEIENGSKMKVLPKSPVF